jgi:ketosteroid isomerase-like protein
MTHRSHHCRQGVHSRGDVETVIGWPATSFEASAQRRHLDQTGGQVPKYTEDISNFGADGPFFHVIREGLKGLADGEDYFDMLADDVVFEYVVSVPGYPKRIEGRQNIIDLYSDYDSFMTVRSADNLRVYRDPAASVVVLEYEVHGESVQSGRPYNNRFVSIVTIKNGKVTSWRDYLDPVAVFDAAGWPGGLK